MAKRERLKLYLCLITALAAMQANPAHAFKPPPKPLTLNKGESYSAFVERKSKMRFGFDKDYPPYIKSATAIVLLDKDGKIIDLKVKVEVFPTTDRKSIMAKSYFEHIIPQSIKIGAPYRELPKDKYDEWKQIIINYDFSKMQ